MIEIESGSGGRPGLARLEPTDGDLVVRLFHRLSPESVYRRFFSPTSKPDLLVASVLQVDHHDREAVAAVEGGEVIGEGITAFALDVQGDNFGALKLLRRVAPGVRLVFASGVGEGRIPLDNDETR